MALTGKEVGRLATTGAVALLLGLLVIVLVADPDTPRGSADGGTSTLELLTPSPTGRATAQVPVAPPPAVSSRPSPAPAPVVPTATRAPVPRSPGPAVSRTPSAAPATSPPAVVVVTPGAAPPTSAPTGRITVTSDLPPGCERVGRECRYLDAPAGSRVGDGPRSVTVSRTGTGTVRVTAVQGAGASPAAVGFVVRVCRCTAALDDVLLEARVSVGTGSSLELSGLQEGLRIWVQELNEAGLSRGAYQDVAAASPSPTTSATPTP